MSLLLALTGSGGGAANYTLACSMGAYGYNGIAASLVYSGGATAYTLVCAPGTYAYTGKAATLTRAVKLLLPAGAYVYSGVAAVVKVARNLPLATGAYSYSGLPSVIKLSRNLSLATRVYSYTGNAATLTYHAGNTPVGYTLTCDTGAYLYTGNDATFTKTGIATGHSGGDDAPWRQEKKQKRKDEYAESVIARKKAVIDAYNGLLDPETPEIVANEAKTVVRLAKPESLDLAKVQKLIAMWQQELERRDEQDDEEALLMLL